MERLENAREPPIWWEAWNKILNPLVRAGSFRSPEIELPATLDALASQGCPVTGILNWQPNLQEAERLRWAGYEMEWALDPKISPAEHETHKNALFNQLEGVDEHWKDLTTLAQVYVSTYWRQRHRRAIKTWRSPSSPWRNPSISAITVITVRAASEPWIYDPER